MAETIEMRPLWGAKVYKNGKFTLYHNDKTVTAKDMVGWWIRMSNDRRGIDPFVDDPSTPDAELNDAQLFVRKMRAAGYEPAPGQTEWHPYTGGNSRPSDNPKKEESKMKKFDQWDLYRAALTTESVDHILVYGPPAVGKTHTAVTYFKENGIPFDQITATEGDMVAEYRGMWIPKDQAFEWFNGLLIRGWTANGGQGMPIVINEVDKFPMECMAILHAILDNKNIASLTLPNGDVVHPGPNFRFIGTMNGIPSDLSEALQSRFQVKIEINEPHESAIALLDDDVAKVAKAMITNSDPTKRQSLRQLLAFRDIRKEIGDEMAAAMVFGVKSYVDVLGAIKVAAY